MSKKVHTVQEPSVCVYDFCGYIHPGHFPTSFWADYWPIRGVTRFGGDWFDVPDMPSDGEPTEEQVLEWTRKHNAPV